MKAPYFRIGGIWIGFYFLRRNFWIGACWYKRGRYLEIQPLPMLGMRVELR